MATIRALERDDLPAVSRLMSAHLGGGDEAAGLVGPTLLDHPWLDPETPSLVAEDDGSLVGFIGAQPRRLWIDGESRRGVCCTHLVVDPASRGGAAGALLLGALLKGEQDLTWSDTANDAVARMWTTFGGRIDHARAYDWLYVLRPLAWSRRAVTAIARKRLEQGAFPVAAVPLHAGGRRLVPRAHPAPPPDVTSEQATAEAIVESLAATSRRVELRVDYDQPALDYTFGLVERHLGTLVRRIVHSQGRPIGWYAYLLRPGDVSRVLHVAAPPAIAEPVFGELVAHAHAAGSAALAGRFEPHLEAPLRLRLAALGFARRAVVHTRAPETDALLSSAASLLTRLDGEWYVT